MNDQLKQWCDCCDPCSAAAANHALAGGECPFCHREVEVEVSSIEAELRCCLPLSLAIIDSHLRDGATRLEDNAIRQYEDSLPLRAYRWSA